MNRKVTPQAQSVLDVLSQRRCHLTADEILGSLNGIGAATVYRALDHLTEMGLIKKLSLGKKSAVYEYVRDGHMHMVCVRCGGVYDISADFSGMVTEAAKCCGHQVGRVEVSAFGLCSVCLAKQASDSENP